MTSYLLDANVLIAWTTASHVHHEAVWDWYGSVESSGSTIATCPITEGALLRYRVREGATARSAAAQLEVLRANSWHHFWPDDIDYSASILGGVIGHRQVTDAYLVALANHHGGRVATLDRGLAALHPEVLLIRT